MAKKKILCGLDRYYPTEEQTREFGHLIMMAYNNKLIVKKTDNGYLAYHSRCDTTKTISKEIVGQARKSHVCPFCYSEIVSVTENTKSSHADFVKMEIGSETYGYYVIYDFELGKPFYADCEQVSYGSGNEFYHRYMGVNMFGTALSLREDRCDWRYKKRFRYSGYYGSDYNSYESKMWTYGYSNIYLSSDKYKNKKEYLTKKADFIVKSNQKKLIIDNLLNEKQIKCVKVFDLKTIDDVYRNNAYINKNAEHIDDLLRHGETLNVYYLDYLRKNKIDLGQYFHYLHDLKELGFKYDKPTDFEHRKAKVAEMVAAERDTKLNEKIAKRYEKLPKYKEDKATIEPFKTSDEIRHCGKVLHNCIGGYVSRFADGGTNIYHLDWNGVMKVAIEIANNGTLIQAHSDNNRKASPRYMKYVKAFCEQNGFTLGRYA